MAFNEKLADRVREIIALNHDQVEEKKMFGGLCFMVDNKMCAGVMKDRLMLRINPDIAETILETRECIPMDFTGKTMKGFIYVEQEHLDSEKELRYWIGLALEYNAIVPARKKK